MLLSDSGRHQLLDDRSDRFGGLFVSKRQLYAAIGVVVTRFGRIRQWRRMPRLELFPMRYYHDRRIGKWVLPAIDAAGRRKQSGPPKSGPLPKVPLCRG